MHPDFDDAVLEHARRDFPLLHTRMSVADALETIRREGVAERPIYFYVVDEGNRLAGVLPTRRLLTAALATPVNDLMITRVVALPATATVLEACEFFVLYKFFAFPVVDEQRRVLGVVDVGLVAEEMLAGDADQPAAEDIFAAVGFRIEQVRGASPWRTFRARFPWLLVTIAAGTLSAVLAGFFEATLARALVVAFFLTMVLGLNESVSMQSMAVTVQALRGATALSSLPRRVWRELVNALLIGAACGVVVATIVWLWRRNLPSALAIGGSLLLSLISAALFGLLVPTLLHRLRLDPKIAAGPVTLAATDLVALAIYFTIARLTLG